MNQSLYLQKELTMQTTHTDSCITEYHEDGSYTETTTVTHVPMTKAQKAGAVGMLGVACVAPFVPLLVLVSHEKMQERRRNRELKKQSDTESD